MDVRTVLAHYGISPVKGLGQNFLKDRGIVQQIIQASELTPRDIVLEVGPGIGTLTEELAKRAGTVISVEIDRRLVSVLRDILRDQGHVHIIEADILGIDPPTEMLRILDCADASALQYKVVANLPYYITSAVLRHLLAAHVRPEMLTVMVQKEVAERIMAQPGDLNLLALSVQVYGLPERICRVPARAFYPQPKVDSAVLRVRVFPQPCVAHEEMEGFFRVVHAGFQQKRKQLHNSLTHGLGLDHDAVVTALRTAGVDPSRRPQTMTIAEWQQLARALPLTRL